MARATGATVLTGGLNLLVRALFNRISAERNVCQLSSWRLQDESNLANPKWCNSLQI